MTVQVMQDLHLPAYILTVLLAAALVLGNLLACNFLVVLFLRAQVRCAELPAA